MVTRRLSTLACVIFVLTIAFGCGEKKDDPKTDNPQTAKPVARHGLSAEQAAEVLVQVGDAKITVGEFADELAAQSPYLRARYNSPERRREFLNNMIRFELLAAEAEKQGLTKLPSVERTKKQVMIQQMMKEKFEEKIRLSDITDKEVSDYYNSHSDEYNKPAQVRVSHILIKNKTKAQTTLKEILAKSDDIAFFREQAKALNEDPGTKDRYGDLRFLGKKDGSDDIPAALIDAAFGIAKIGGVSKELVQTDKGYHIVKLTSRRAALKRSLSEAKRPIQNLLWRQKREQAIADFVESLKKKANVKENAKALSEVTIDIPEGMAVPSPGEMQRTDILDPHAKIRR